MFSNRSISTLNQSVSQSDSLLVPVKDVVTFLINLRRPSRVAVSFKVDTVLN